jgi:hypothetical protein
MGRALCVAAVLWLATPRAAPCQSTRVPPTQDQARVQVAAVDAALHAALLAADVKALERILHEGFVWTHSNGIRLSVRQLLDQLGSGSLRYVRLETRNVTVSIHGPTAVVRGDSLRQRSANPQAPGAADAEPLTIFYTLTLVDEGGSWRAVAMHTSRP